MEISSDKLIKLGNFKKETESLQIPAKKTKKNNAIKIGYVKTKIDKTQENIKRSLCGDKNETVNHISECIKPVQSEFNTWHD